MEKILAVRKECGDYVHKIKKATGIHMDKIKRYLELKNIEPKFVGRIIFSEV